MRSLNRGAFTALALASVLILYFTASMAPAANLVIPAADVAAPARPGGWSAAQSRDDQVVRAAHFALAEKVRQTQSPLKLLAIKHVRQQVVAGMNYSMNLLVLSEGQRRLVIAVVWAKPDGSMELTRWHWV
jgi:hypothetical protein